jgi:hypothetical protein
MPFVLIAIGAVLLIAALRNTQGDLAAALKQDAPGFLKWAAALVGVGALGYVPGTREISRYLMALVIVVLILKNYQAILQGFTSIQQPPAASAASTTPGEAQVAAPGTVPTAAQVSGTSSGTAVTSATPTTGALDPAAFLTAFEHGIGGFGGIA